MKSFRLPLLILLFFAILLSTVRLFQFDFQRRVLKEDFVELSMAKYGIFNVDEWKSIIARIISNKVDEFNIEGGNRDVMRMKIQGFLYKVLDDSEDNFKDDKSGSLFGLLQKSVASVTDIFGHLKSEVPKITEDILTFLDDPTNRDQIKIYLRKLLDKYADETFASVDYSKRDSILSKYNSESKTKGIKAIQNLVDKIKGDARLYEWVVAVSTSFLLVFFLIWNNVIRSEIIVGLLASFVLLGAGVFLPMLDIDARISSFDFSILGEHVSFENQILYYKSKSILEVVSLMMMQGQLKIFLVGLLILSFSVLFPLSKLISSTVYLFQPTTHSLKWVQFFVFKSGKWSMADVMVVAIFMSYIGFTSILTEQLRQLEGVGKNLEILTTNQSTLNTGFYLFTAFVVVSLVVGNRIMSRMNVNR